MKDCINDYMKKPGLNGLHYDFSVDRNTNNNANIVDIRKYLLKKHDML